MLLTSKAHNRDNAQKSARFEVCGIPDLGEPTEVGTDSLLKAW